MPNMNDYFRLLKAKIDSDEREAYLRLRAWRAGNDRRRRSEHGPRKFRKNGKPLAPLAYPEIKNMKELVCILDEQDDEERLLKAELFRELGFFNQCLNCLAKPLDCEYKAAAGFISELAAEKRPLAQGDQVGSMFDVRCSMLKKRHRIRRGEPCVRLLKFQIPSTKSQINSKIQIPMTQTKKIEQDRRGDVYDPPVFITFEVRWLT